MEKMKMHSTNYVEKNIDKIQEVFPNCITESIASDGRAIRSIDFDLLRQELSSTVVDGPQERYQINWPGKRKALLLANTPITKTLVPNEQVSVNFDATQNIFIEGDNLEALKLIQESYLESIRIVYIDPPYNTGNDFIYADKYVADAEEYLKNSGQKSQDGDRLVANPQTSGRFHSDWLSMMYPRLKLSRNLLKDNGVIFVSIGDNELGRLQQLMDEIFGAQNYLGIISRITKTTSDAGQFFAPSIDYILCYSKNINKLKPFKIALSQELIDDYKKEDAKGKYKLVGFYQASLSLERSRNARYFIDAPDGSKCIPPENKRWRTVKETYDQFIANNEIEFVQVKSSPLLDGNGNQSKWNVYTKQYLDRRMDEGRTPRNFIDDAQNHAGTKDIASLDIPFDFPKPVALLKKLIEIGMTGDKDGIILDFFGGSGTTGHAVYEMNAEDLGHRKFITVQLDESCDEESEAFKKGYKKISDITLDRLKKVGAKISNELPLLNDKLDIGIRCFKIDSSNLQDVFYSPDLISQDLLSGQIDNIKGDRTSLDLLFQVFLDWGLSLSLPIHKESICGMDVYFVDQNALIACFDGNGGIDEDFVKELTKQQPLRVVFRDAGFKSDSIKINVEQIFKLLSPSTEVKCI